MIRLEGLTREYGEAEARFRALDEIDLHIYPGDFITVVGTSGSGKTTLLNVVGGLDSDFEGKALVDGKDLKTMSDENLSRFRNQTVGFVFQQFNLLPKTSALENVKLPLFYSRDPGIGDANERAKACLELVGLADRMGHETTQLSGGQQQRVAIARALVNKPSVILADEPTGALDTKTSLEILDLFRELNESGITVMVVTHDQEVADESRRSLLFRDGRIVDDTVMRN